MLAVKGLGGYHLAVDARSQPAAARLRAAKHREDKPFAVMVPDLAAARELCQVDELAESLLTSARRPIVLLPRRAAAGQIADAVAPGNRQLGLMLPYTPLHHLLLRGFPHPMVLTSGNVSDEPIAYRDDDALARLGGIADAFLTHDRPIHIRTDDSVVRPFRGRPAVLRRSRGYAPEPLAVRNRFSRPVLACGAELKNTFCLGRGAACVPLAAHRGSGELRDAALVHRGHRALPAAVRRHPGAGRARPAPGVPVHQVRARPARRRAGRGAAPPRAHRVLPGRQRRRPGRSSGWRSTAPGSARTARSGAASSCSPTWPRRSGAARWPGCPCRAGPPRSGSRGGWPPCTWTRPSPARCPTAWPWPRAIPRPGLMCWRWPGAGSTRRSPPAPGGCSTRSPRCSGCATRSTTRARPRSSWSSSPRGRGAAAATRPGSPRARRSPSAGCDLVRAAAGDLLAGLPPDVISARFHRGVADLIVAGVPAAARVVRAGHGRAVRRRVPEPAAARDGRQPAGSERVPGADPLPGAAQRRRDQPGPGRGSRRPGPRQVRQAISAVSYAPPAGPKSPR